MYQIGSIAPVEFAQVRQRLVKDVRRQFFRSRPFAHSPGDIGVHRFEVKFIQFGKAARIVLRRLN